MTEVSVSEGSPSGSFLYNRWWAPALALAVATAGLNLAIVPKTATLIEHIFVGSLWFSPESGQLSEILETARRGLVFYSIASGFKVAALILFTAGLARAVLALGGLSVPFRTCGVAACAFASVLFVKNALGALSITMIPTENATMDSLRFKAGLSLFYDTHAWGPALDYLADKADLFGVGSVVISSAWLRRRPGVTWPRALSAMLLPALAALSAGLILHMMLSAKLDQIGTLSP